MSAALDLTRPRRLNHPQQDVGQSRFAPTPSRCRWFVLATLPKAERRAHASLHLRGFNAYLPLITTRRRDRSWHTAPLWPGYCFVELDPTKPWYPLRWAPGVFQLLTINGIPLPCPRGLVEAVRAGEAERATPPAQNAFWAPGMPCSLATGPFSGHQAIVTAVHNDRAAVALMMLGQLREISVSLDCLTARDE